MSKLVNKFFACQHCHKKFDSWKALKQHNQAKHFKPKIIPVKNIVFCEECNNLLSYSIQKGGLMCGACGLFKPCSLKEKQHHKLTQQEILSKIHELNPFVWKDEDLKSDVSNFECPSCGYNKARLIYKQIRAIYRGTSDFTTNEFLKCLKCGKVIKK